ncbi:MAG: GNAT family N-acetyltransferase [Flavobacteriales bacterium]|jgi:predicted GNAT family N-acyltransferase|nr:GNAT family N-acetyltransferase [Flavobacteriales bacterium]MBT6014021.1 GNAT family N-acetyltransferase [Flavobacteriales bacterium]MBT7481898.1 GNAT family N-acetyltransferase [Flavobacteriales bacterium]
MIEIKKFPFSDKENLEKAFSIRKEVFVVEQRCPPDLEYEFEEDCIHFLLKENGEAIVASRYRKTDKGIKLERFAVLKEHRKKGLGHKILQFMLDDLNNFDGKIYMHAQVDVIPFYEKMGFVKQGDLFEEANIMHYKMTLKK